jgi:alkanesulfonate monooxygenase SsuD/methylene tetrahydromethanopterin reductase-like flavin-dependent oxidoreductase (luciferase family)
MTALDFGLLIHATPRGGTLPAMRETNERLLQAACEHNLTAWFVDHFQIDDQFLLECFAFLAHTAGRYPGLTTGTLVLGQSYRNPALTAKIAASLQYLTGGRFILGIGAGWKEDEYRAYGYPFPPARERIAQLDEAVRIVKALWGAAPVSFAGEHYRIADAYCEPRPDPPPILMIGGGGERRTLRVVAEHADWWNADYYTPADYGRKLRALREHCRELGRDPATITPTYYAGVSIARDPARLVRRPAVSYRPDMHFLSGDPDEVTAQLAEFAALGVAEVQLNFLDFPRTESLDLFLGEVLPRFTRRETDSRTAG